MILNEFKLSNYKRTRGREGEGFTATLMYKNKPVAEYEDFATGALPSIYLEKNGWGQENVLSTIQEIHKSNTIPYLDINDIEDCTENLFQILEEGRMYDDMFIKLQKKSANEHYVSLILVGGSWHLAKLENESYEIGELYGNLLNPKIEDMSMAKQATINSIRNSIKQKDFQHCIGFLILELKQKAPITMTVEEYTTIFDNAKKI